MMLTQLVLSGADKQANRQIIGSREIDKSRLYNQADHRETLQIARQREGHTEGQA